MPSTATLTLHAVTDDIQPRTRVIRVPLYPDNVPVGRASKSPSKGLVGQMDNAWFESPVMSRKHAQIFFDKEKKAIMIEDVGAMHGTRVNGKQLTPTKPFLLNTNDTVIFGAEVRRGQEVFPACEFKVETSIIPRTPPHASLSGQALPSDTEEVQTSSNTFKCPYDSDFEFEGDDIYNSEEEGLYSAERSSENGNHHRLATEAIDLTHDSDSSVSSKPSVFSTTGVADRAGKPEVTSVDNEQGEVHENSSMDSRGGAASCPVDLDDDNKCGADYSPDDDGNLSDDSVIDVDESDEDSEDDEFSYGIDSASGDVQDIDDAEESSEDGHSVLSGCEVHEGAMDDVEVTSWGAAAGCEVEAEEEEVTYGQESCFVCGPDLDDGSSEVSYSPQQHDDGVSERDSLFGDHESDVGVKVDQQLPTSTSPQLPHGFERLPSPSDAAMPRRYPGSASVDPVKTICTFENNMAESFAAPMTRLMKDVDWERLAKSYGNNDRSQFLQTMYANKATLELQRDHQSFEAATADLKKRLHNIQNIQKSSPVVQQSLSDSLSTSLDVSKPVLKTPTTKIPIEAICVAPQAQTPAYTSGLLLKRKIDDISEIPLEEAADSFMQHGDSSANTPVKFSMDLPATDSAAALSSASIASIDTPAPEQRAAKRLKRFAEAAGYATLGAIAAGAGLFSVLVATAPEFV